MSVSLSYLIIITTTARLQESVESYMNAIGLRTIEPLVGALQQLYRCDQLSLGLGRALWCSGQSSAQQPSD